jgi:hypothetical protein
MRIQIVPCDTEHLAAALEDPAALAARLRATIADGVIEREWQDAFRFARDELVRRPEIAHCSRWRARQFDQTGSCRC